MDKFKNKLLKIIREDGDGKVSVKVGKALSLDNAFIEIEGTQGHEFLPLNRILRIEVLQEERE